MASGCQSQSGIPQFRIMSGVTSRQSGSRTKLELFGDNMVDEKEILIVDIPLQRK